MSVCVTCKKDFDLKDGGIVLQENAYCPKCLGECNECSHLRHFPDGSDWCYMFVEKVENCAQGKLDKMSPQERKENSKRVSAMFIEQRNFYKGE